ncbi:MAG: amidohydrolase [Firmicutes bacterium]|nr:amidohydrolase [Bacillota bacterium]
MSTLKELVQNRNDEILEVYNELHAIPELSTQEFKTSRFIKEYLVQYGFEVTSGIAGTGLVTYIDSGVEGPVLAVRVDIDALEHPIDGEIVMKHSCGHDANTTMAIFSAITAKEAGLVKKGSLKVIFQPSEERDETSGARAMVKAGVIDDVDMLIGIHLRPQNELRLGQAIAGMRHSALNTILAEIKGVGTHAGRPHQGKNPIDAIAAVINAVNAIWVDPAIPWSIKLTSVHADGGNNSSVPANGRVGMDLRANSNEVMDELIEKAKAAITAGAATVGCEADIEVIPGLPAGIIDEGMAKIAAEAITEVLGSDGCMSVRNTPGGDDFTIYPYSKRELKATFLGLGADLTPGLHHPDMNFDKKALANGVSIISTMIQKILG